MGGSCLFGVDSSDHLGAVVECLLGLESSLSGQRSTWLPVMPWQMTLVCLLTQTLGAVEKQDLSSLVIMIYLCIMELDLLRGIVEKWNLALPNLHSPLNLGLSRWRCK